MTYTNPVVNADNNRAMRRQILALPSRRKHIAFAALSALFLILTPIAYTSIFGNAKDAQSYGTAAVVPLPPIEALAPLDDETLETPDILAGELGAGQNPTTTSNALKVDALGNPINNGNNNFGNNAPQSNGQAAASQTTSGQSFPAQSGTKTILIDGQAIGPSRLAPAPFDGLTVDNQYGKAPAKGPNGRTALNSYNRPFTAPAGKRPVSIIIGGLGVNRTITQQAIDILPPDITLSFAAHVTGLQDWVNRARDAGHEVMIEIPMESADFNPTEPGADKTLLTTLSAAENMKHIEWLLSRAQGFFGVINYNGNSFLVRADATAPLLSKLSDSGLGFITDGAVSAPTLPALSRSVKLPYKNSFGLIDPAPNAELINSQLQSLSGAALSGGAPIGVGFAYPETLEAISNWVTSLEAQGLVLAPASHSIVK